MWFTGCFEPGCFAVLDGKSKQFAMFFPFLGPEHELWVGKVEPLEAKKRYNATLLKYEEELPKYLESLGARTAHVILDIPTIPNLTLPSNLKPVNDLYIILGELRLTKDAYEIAQMEATCAINSKAFNYVMSHLKPGMHEYNAEAMHKFIYLSHGARLQSFEAITASGAGASTLHFINNVNEIKPSQTFLLDAGCEVNCYCSDHTRTFPSSERFTEK